MQSDDVALILRISIHYTYEVLQRKAALQCCGLCSAADRGAGLAEGRDSSSGWWPPLAHIHAASFILAVLTAPAARITAGAGWSASAQHCHHSLQGGSPRHLAP